MKKENYLKIGRNKQMITKSKSKFVITRWLCLKAMCKYCNSDLLFGKWHAFPTKYYIIASHSSDNKITSDGTQFSCREYNVSLLAVHAINYRQLEAIEKVQDAMNAHNAISKTLPMIERTGEVAKEYLTFLTTVLFNACKSSQVSRNIMCPQHKV